MDLFQIGAFLLLVGYYTYGKFVEKVLGPDDRPTPAMAHPDGVDYVILPQWKNMLIQLLNIAGIGPVIGVILGIKFGPIVFILIPIGNVLGGAVHDFVAAMMSMREDGGNLPRLIQKNLGKPVYVFFSFFVILLLLLIVAVFINVPAGLINDLLPKADWFWTVVGMIFLYYILATLFPIDKIIGRFYPIFGFLLLLGTALIFFSILLHHSEDPAHFMVVTDAFKANMFTSKTQPIIPCLFVTIACGILSGFHATQSPIVVRTMKSEHEARATFYGMMIVEGLIAMVWAAAALAIYNLSPELMKESGVTVLGQIAERFLHNRLGTITILAVVILAITSGDTAMRSLRLILADTFSLSQRPILNRLILSLPLVIIVAGILLWSNKDKATFNVLWNYFAWGNQVLAAITLLAATAWLIASRKNFWITVLPGAFMTFVVITFILWTSTKRHGPIGFGLPLNVSYSIAGGATAFCVVGVFFRGRYLRPRVEKEEKERLETLAKSEENQKIA